MTHKYEWDLHVHQMWTQYDAPSQTNTVDRFSSYPSIHRIFSAECICLWNIRHSSICLWNIRHSSRTNIYSAISVELAGATNARQPWKEAAGQTSRVNWNTTLGAISSLCVSSRGRPVLLCELVIRSYHDRADLHDRALLLEPFNDITLLGIGR